MTDTDVVTVAEVDEMIAHIDAKTQETQQLIQLSEEYIPEQLTALHEVLASLAKARIRATSLRIRVINAASE